MRANIWAILEGLHGGVKEARRLYGYDEVDFPPEDILVVDNRRKLEDAISVGLEKKYAPDFAKYGTLEVSVDIDLTDDDARELVDVADAIHVSFFLSNIVDGTSSRDVLKSVASLRPLKGFKPKYDSRSDVYYIDAENNQDCADLLDSFVRDGIPMKKLYHIESADEIERAVLQRRREDREDRAYQDAEYFRSRM